jgi:ribonucleoside-diphosphate reductase alpha chain
MDNPDVLLDADIQREGAEVIKAVNKKIAALIGVNQAARTTCVKPAGSTSCVLSSSSGIHPHHARRYIRRVQANRNEFPVQHFKKVNPLAVEKSVWSTNGTDEVISFLCEVPKGAITKNNLRAVDLLEKVKLTQQNWVNAGTNVELCSVPYVRHNVSNTITIKDSEWEEVTEYIYNNREWFAGISLLAASGDLDYPQAPFTSVLDEKELVAEYGPGAILASGLIVDGLAVFDNNLWAACDTLNDIGEKLGDLSEPIEPQKPSRKGFKSEKEYSSALANYAIELNLFFQDKGDYRLWELKKDWIRRANQFSDRYFNADKRKMAHCLKHCYTLKQWLDLKREYKEVDWTDTVEENETYVSADTLGAQACAGGKCSI